MGAKKKAKRPGKPNIDGRATFDLGARRVDPYCEIIGQSRDLCRDAYGRSLPWLYGSSSTWTNSKTAFLIGRGWSATSERWRAIQDAGIPAMAVNHCPDDITPRLWCSGDPPGYFDRRIWLDPSILKFCCIEYAKSFIPRLSAYGEENQRTPLKCPNVVFFNKMCNDDPDDFLMYPWVNWGTLFFGKNTPNCQEAIQVRSSMLIGLRLLFHLGFREIVLLGCDFAPHEHPHPDYYEELSRQLEALNPVMRKYGLRVFNANPDAHLRAFPFVGFDSVLQTRGAASVRGGPAFLEKAGAA